VKHLFLMPVFLTALASAVAGEADVIDVTAKCSSDSVCDFHVTVRHEDDGWDHYADRWEVLAVNGTVLGVRELLHPHENEQPFTRSLSDVEIPADIDEVIVRARDSVHEYGGKEITVQLVR
jgi:hypothetical protein